MKPKHAWWASPALIRVIGVGVFWLLTKIHKKKDNT